MDPFQIMKHNTNDGLKFMLANMLLISGGGNYKL